MTDELNKQFGGEPMLLLEVAWDGTTFRKYSDRKLNGLEIPEAKVISVGKFDTTTVVGQGSDAQSVPIVMDDTDGTIRALIDDHDVHLVPVRLSLTFQGLPATESALMFEGVINSPLVWIEPERTLSFTVVSKLEETEAGFTMEDGDFPWVPPSERNKPWPLVFGQVCNMEAVQVTALRKGFLVDGVGVADPTLDERLCQAQFLTCPLITDVIPATPAWTVGTTRPTYSAEDIAACQKAWRDLNIRTDNYGPAGGQHVNLCGGSVLYWPTVRTSRPDPGCISKKANEICNILRDKERQEKYVKTTFTVNGGADFPQGTPITIEVGDVQFEGIMTGTSFRVTTTHHPDEDTIDNPPCTSTPDSGLGWREDWDYDDMPISVADCDDGGTKYQEDVRNGSALAWEYYESFEKGSFIWLPPGSEVRLVDETALSYIVSLLPGTVTQVAAYRTFADTTILSAIPTTDYTVHLTNFGDYNVTEVRLNKRLSTIEDASWDDDIYVNFTSSVGPNPTAIIDYLVGKYTSYTVDATSFAAVAALLTNYPSNFYIKARPNVMSLIKDIAYQARCAVFIRDNVVYITYLPYAPTPLKTLTETDILNGSFRFDHTATERLETKHVISWSEGDAGVFKEDPTDFEFTLKHNIPKYGNFEAEYDYYTYNIYELVEKSATFWMIRKANTWRYVEFETPMKHLDLDVFDCVTLNIAQFPSVNIVIEETVYNADKNTITFKAWTPVRSGEKNAYYWAWPSQQSASIAFPLASEEDQASGDGTGITVVPPVGHPLRAGYDPDRTYPDTDGDRYPSDLDDTLPTLTCKLATSSTISDDLEPIFNDLPPNEPKADDNFREKMEEIENRGSNVNNPDDSEEKGACGEPGWEQSGCEYEVTVMYVNPSTLTTAKPPGGNCNSGGPCKSAVPNGVPCTGLLHTMCHSFGALFAARFFSRSKQAEADNMKENCLYSSGVISVYLASDPVAIPCDDCVAGECEDVTGPGDSTAPGADAGEIKQPACIGIGDPGKDACPGTDGGYGITGPYLTD
jgi:hypothetical protein